MDKSLKIQTQIRENAEEVQSFLKDLNKWQTNIALKDQRLTATRSHNTNNNNIQSNSSGYSSILNENVIGQLNTSLSGVSLTPASIISPQFVAAANDGTSKSVPKPIRQISSVDPEASERLRGNEEFQRGDFQGAVRSYTRCLGE
jgi:hypothetical protein